MNEARPASHPPTTEASRSPTVWGSAGRGELRLERRLGVWSTAAILVGVTIGSGIFRVPSVAAAEAGTLASVALLWIVGGAVALFGALTIAELAALFPH